MYISDNVIVNVLNNLDPINKISLLLTCKTYYRLRDSIVYRDVILNCCTERNVKRLKQINGSVLPILKQSSYNSVQFEHHVQVIDINRVPDPDDGYVVAGYKPAELHSYIENNVERLIITIFPHITINNTVLLPRLTHLKFEGIFNQPLTPYLFTNCKQLQYLWLGNQFAWDIRKGVLPSSLKALYVGNAFNNRIEVGALPSSLKHIEFGNKYQVKLESGVIPEGCQHVNMGSAYSHAIEPSTFPSSLKELIICDSKYGPGFLFNQLQVDLSLKPDILPKGLKYLHLSLQYCSRLEPGILPESLETLSLSSPPRITNPAIFPKTLKSLILSDYNHPIETKIFPEGLEYLRLGELFNHPILPNILPQSLKTLMFNESFQSQLHQLPPNLEKLNIKTKLTYLPSPLPKSISSLFLNIRPDSQPFVFQFPPELKDLTIFYPIPVPLPTTLTSLTLQVNTQHCFFNESIIPLSKLPNLEEISIYGVQSLTLPIKLLKQLKKVEAHQWVLNLQMLDDRYLSIISSDLLIGGIVDTLQLSSLHYTRDYTFEWKDINQDKDEDQNNDQEIEGEELE